MAEYNGWVTLGDESPKPLEKIGSCLKALAEHNSRHEV